MKALKGVYVRSKQRKGKRLTAVLALGTMLISQIGIPLAQAQSDNRLDAKFRNNVNNAGGAVAAPADEEAPPADVAKTKSAEQIKTKTPIKHVILIIGENRTFDHVFATYTPPAGQTVNNLLSEGIVNGDGTPGPNFASAQQFSASDLTAYSNSPGGKTAFANLPDMITGGAPTDAHFTSTE